ncbi:hydrolase [Aureibacillus halotolerans]|uniref:Hydrolase n=1 Tax=Aureibacillus halotolerans TaxID=1508390 RepID=A0A4R6U1U4_9BACI|nr:hydrolase [Aureibacillus halotolerans]TDQ40300.1 hypothetical protein EV213_10616 [Aureibacillus halotolerans]
MEKQVYTVSVAKREINANESNSPFEFRVVATEEEIDILREMFHLLDSHTFDTFVRAHVPFLQYHEDRENDQYDRQMIHIYGYIEQIGDERTREHIHSMNLSGG